jgi:[ribosomal protein S5]-alanine N-acetyltransferase
MADSGRVVEVSGSRVTLARFRASDFDAVHAFAADPRVCEFTTWGPNTREDTRAFIAEATAPMTDGYLLAVMLGAEVIGSAAVWMTSRDDRTGELGYTIRRDCWGRGIGTEVATLLLQLGFQRLGLERIAATCAPDNVGSVRVLEKAGLRLEGLLRGHVLVGGRRRNSLIFGCLVTDDQKTG